MQQSERKFVRFEICLVLTCFLAPRVATSSNCLFSEDHVEWVLANGSLFTEITRYDYLDLSFAKNVDQRLAEQVSKYSPRGRDHGIRYLSLANAKLKRFPALNEVVYGEANGGIYGGTSLDVSLTHLTLFGNDFSDQTVFAEPSNDVALNATGATSISVTANEIASDWTTTLNDLSMVRLRELDLRDCKIRYIPEYVFETTTKLKKLYLSGNQIEVITSNAFHGLSELTHLYINRNEIVNNLRTVVGLVNGVVLQNQVFTPLRKINLIDLSNSPVSQTNIEVFSNFSSTLEQFSICNTRVINLLKDSFQGTNLKYLDISGNPGMYSDNYSALDAIKSSLVVLRASMCAANSYTPFMIMKKLKLLDLSQNSLTTLPKMLINELPDLEVLDLDNNRITSWQINVIPKNAKITLLSLNNNNMNVLTESMLDDFKLLRFLAIGQNYVVCNCLLTSFMETAIYMNDSKVEDLLQLWLEQLPDDAGFRNYKDKILTLSTLGRVVQRNRNRMNTKTNTLSIGERRDGAIETNVNDQRFFLFDYTIRPYTCYDNYKNILKKFGDIGHCLRANDNDVLDDQIAFNQYLVYMIMVTAVVCLPLIGLIIWKWWYFRYFFILFKNAATLSLINDDDGVNEDGEISFAYDVFVSYCNGDRVWVLDHLLPRIENNRNINICLHERDFQVGLSILENIITCMDRSRAILLVISQEFLLSQWCQFEMHLAQHRLLETRRERLVLVLLEDIPRRKRPNTLHYLMMTKTYIVWPKSEDLVNINMFWKRLTKALMQGNQACILEQESFESKSAEVDS